MGCCGGGNHNMHTKVQAEKKKSNMHNSADCHGDNHETDRTGWIVLIAGILLLVIAAVYFIN